MLTIFVLLNIIAFFIIITAIVGFIGIGAFGLVFGDLIVAILLIWNLVKTVKRCRNKKKDKDE